MFDDFCLDMLNALPPPFQSPGGIDRHGACQKLHNENIEEGGQYTLANEYTEESIKGQDHILGVLSGGVNDCGV